MSDSTASPISCRTVKRFYYAGKGYGTLFNAARAMAKRELTEQVRCTVSRLTKEYRKEIGCVGGIITDDQWSLLHDFEEGVWRLAYAEHFPHPADFKCSCNREDYDGYGRPYGGYAQPLCLDAKHSYIERLARSHMVEFRAFEKDATEEISNA